MRHTSAVGIAEDLAELRALDRRLMAFAGDLQTRLETEIDIVTPIGGGTLRPPNQAELSRLEIELESIAGVLASICERNAIASSPRMPPVISRSDAPKAYAAFSRWSESLRAKVQNAFDRVRAEHPAPNSEPALPEDAIDPELQVEGSIRSFLRFRPRIALAVVGIPVIAALVYWASQSTRREQLEFAAKICSAPPPCEGDAPTISALERPGLKGTANGGFILHRRSSGCDRDIEAFFDTSGKFRFRGSSADPDAAKAEEFDRRRADWMADKVVVNTVACSAVDDLM